MVVCAGSRAGGTGVTTRWEEVQSYIFWSSVGPVLYSHMCSALEALKRTFCLLLLLSLSFRSCFAVFGGGNGATLKNTCALTSIADSFIDVSVARSLACIIQPRFFALRATALCADLTNLRYEIHLSCLLIAFLASASVVFLDFPPLNQIGSFSTTCELRLLAIPLVFAAS
ncbi:hypothetical protein CC80DRAFT_159789 [Byssothecium circinans]|uniref:Uncharacterized protein n=1 Tax=Byssothecium circinans TaxID=147558 RepID=A0A6A5UEG4_9PLEO|nr:hypothetical protein CC80DRAFT_159789 [Byssothecium circinans]